MVPRFEQAVAARVGAKHAIAVNGATSALHIAWIDQEQDRVVEAVKVAFSCSHSGKNLRFLSVDEIVACNHLAGFS